MTVISKLQGRKAFVVIILIYHDNLEMKQMPCFNFQDHGYIPLENHLPRNVYCRGQL